MATVTAAAETTATLSGFNEFVALVKEHLTTNGAEAFSWQLGAIVVAILLGITVSVWLNRRSVAWEAQAAKGNSVIVRTLFGFLMRICDGVAFSLVAASSLALLVHLLQMESFLGHGRLLLAKMAYSVFYAWAIIVVSLELLSGMLRGKISKRTLRVIKILFWVLAILHIVGILPEAVKILESVTLPVGNGKVSLWSAMVGLFTVVVSLIFANWLSDLTETALMSHEAVAVNLRVVFSRILRFVFYFFAVLFALSFAGVDLTVLSVFSGALGVGLGFGLQKIASNYVSGFIILLDRSVNLGDMVQVGTFTGVIKEINTRYSVIRNTSGEELVVPNETFVTTSVKNFTGTDSDAASYLNVSVSYEGDVEHALAIFLDCIKAQKRVLKTPAPWCVIKEFGDSGIEMMGCFWVRDPELGVAGLKSAIFREVLRRFDEEKIEIPYSKSEIKLSGTVNVVSEDIRRAIGAAAANDEARA